MQDLQNNLSTSNFKDKQRLLLKYAAMFFIPVVLCYVLVELLVINIPENYIYNSNYYKKNKDTIKIIALGSSQMAGAVNPEYFDKPGICLASSSQHHKLDFTILKQLLPETKQLKFVVLELSYSHLELPHNSKDFWKNSVYLKYYNVNAFERKTYFKDRLIYLANPDLYSRKLVDYYLLKKENQTSFNKFGFDTNSFQGIFNSYHYNEKAISKLTISPNQKQNDAIFEYNSNYLLSMISYLKNHDITVIVCTLPLYKTYRKNLNPVIKKRRDSVLKLIKEKYPSTVIFETENDSITFKITDFNNHNHLNPKGAKKFTKKLNVIINSVE